MTRPVAAPKAPPRAHVLAVAVGLAVAGLLGALAAWRGADERGWWLTFAVFTAVAAAPCLSLGWVLFVSKHTVVADLHGEDNVEDRWLTQAMSGAFTDLVTAAGVLTAVIALGRFEFGALPVLVGFLVAAFADTAVRYAVLRHRGI